jgi:hypothetical protein
MIFKFLYNDIANPKHEEMFYDDKPCPNFSFIVGMRLKICKIASNSAICGIELKCSNNVGNIKPYDNPSGTWGSWQIVQNGSYICGSSLRYKETGKDILDLLMTGVKLQTCQMKVIEELYSSQEYQMIGEGYWGDWLGKVPAPKGTLACGVQIQFNPKKKDNELDKDDTAIEELNFIYCRIDDWDKDQKVMQQQLIGKAAYWTNMKCSRNQYISEVRVNIQPLQGAGLTKTEYGILVSADDRGLTGISLLCKTLNYDVIRDQERKIFWELDNYNDAIEPTTENKFVCGSEVRYERVDPKIRDLTGVNGLKVKYCEVESFHEQ